MATSLAGFARRKFATVANFQPSLLDSVIAAHGGLSRWSRIRKLSCTWNFHGLLLDLKGFPGWRQPTITIDTKVQPNAIITGLHGDPTNKWVFGADYVSIVNATGQVLKERRNPRDSFRTHVRYPPTPWDELDLLYFVGYAMYNYLVTPFIFATEGFATRELKPYREQERGETWRVLEVTYSDGWPMHTKVQRFYFGESDFLLRRLDYYADVVHSSAAHFCFDLKSYGGIVVPTYRRVVRRVEGENGRPLLSATSSFGLHYAKVTVEDELDKVEEMGRFVEVQTNVAAENAARTP
ncbi:MAG: hypothetical protein M1821_003856 [Bathelium mastoideum]|nr:MAG: hypothetical protein M1821_003856 [Bathelium mastoideum]